MSVPTNLLRFVSTAVLNAAARGADAGVLVSEILWSWSGSDRATEIRRRELADVSWASADELTPAIRSIVQELTSGQPPVVGQVLTAYLIRVVTSLRTLVSEPMVGGAVRISPSFQQSRDLLSILPEVPAELRQARPVIAVTLAPRAAAAAKPPSPDPDSHDRYRITLTVVGGPHQPGTAFQFDGHDTFIVGRSSKAHFRLPLKDKFFSRTHFMVEVNPPFCRLMDLGSRNGTKVNGVDVKMADLKDGDRIEAGQTIFQVAVENTIPQPPSPKRTGPDLKPVPAQPMPTQPPRVLSSGGRCPVCGKLAEGAQGTVSGVCADCQAQANSRPQIIKGYHLIRELGKGGMGVVYLAVRENDGLVVALKTIIPSIAGTASQVERFLREARILQQLQHPNIVSFLEMGESAGQFFFAMDYVRGRDANNILKSEGRLDIGRAVNLICQMLDALEFAHRRGFVHRDIKPHNLLVALDTETEVAKLADFGLARTYQSSHLSGLTMTGEMGGTLGYMAPEQITHYREAKPPVDQFAAAAALYHLLTGSHIYNMQGTLQQQLLTILHDNPIPLLSRRPEVPQGLADIVHRGLRKDPAERYPSAQAMRDALAPYLART